MSAEPTPDQVALAHHLDARLGHALDALDAGAPQPRPSSYRPPMVDEARGAVWTDLMNRIDNLTETDA